MNTTPKANVYAIGTGRKIAPGKAANEDGPRTRGGDDGGMSAGEDSRNGFGLFLRHVLVILMMWLRGPLRFLVALIAVPTMIALPIVIFGMDSSPQKVSFILGLLALSLGSFTLRWLYDSLIMWVSPDPLFLNS